MAEGDSKPCFELYIKASLIDGQQKGSCPICQQWFMVAYILAEKECVSFKVFTVSAEKPPQSFTQKIGNIQPSSYPVVIGLSGENTSGSNIEKLIVHHTDDVSNFFESVNNRFPDLHEKSDRNNRACNVFLDLQRDFNSFLRDKNNEGRKLISTLKSIDEHLQSLQTKFLMSDELSFADCALLPKLQHIRIAGEVFKHFHIPEELTGIWNYLENGYSTNAFLDTMPADQDIMLRHEEKCFSWHKRQYTHVRRPTLQKESYTTSVVRTFPKQNVQNGNGHDIDHSPPSPDSMQQQMID